MISEILSIPPEELQAVLKVLGAALLAGLIGIEREIFDKPAGFRTHMLVGAASALLVLLGQEMVDNFGNAPETASYLRTDPIRIMEAIIVGVSFIGAGTILKVEAEHRVRYLTTAASTLLSAGVGIAVALEKYFLCISLVISVVLINLILGRIEELISRKRGE